MKRFFINKSIAFAVILLLTGAIFMFSGDSRIPLQPTIAMKGITSASASPSKSAPLEDPPQNILNMDTGIWYETFYTAIAAAAPGNRLALNATLQVENVVVNKSVMILGALTMNHTVDGGSSGPTFTITADGVVILWIRVINNGSYAGVKIESNNNFISSNEIDGCKEGVYLTSGTSGNEIFNNEITNSSTEGIKLYESTGNLIVSNTITGCIENGEMGILISQYSDNNTISANTVNNNNNGIFISSSSYNLIYHNNFVNNTANARIFGACIGNQWYKGYLYGGNYWSDHSGYDYYMGPLQNMNGLDTFLVSVSYINSPYYIPYGGGAHDKYPLLVQWDIASY